MNTFEFELRLKKGYLVEMENDVPLCSPERGDATRFTRYTSRNTLRKLSRLGYDVDVLPIKVIRYKTKLSM